MSNYRIRLGIVGCGAVVENLHLPASLSVPEIDLVALIDVNLERAQNLAERFGVLTACADYQYLFDRVDAVLLATPPYLHAMHGCEFLDAGIHVLCEKPLSLTVKEGQAMVDAATRSGVVLAVGHHRRFHANKFLLKKMIDGGAFGRITNIHLEDGFEFVWPTQTAYMFDQSTTGVGVLLENGIHALDTLLWLFGPVTSVVDYADDALGGLESNAFARFQFESGAVAHMRISRTATLSNTMDLQGEEGWARLSLYSGDELAYTGCDKLSRGLGQVRLLPEIMQDSYGPWVEQLADFARSIQQGRSPRVPGNQALKAVALVQQCYAQVADRPLPAVAPLPGVPR